MPIDTYFSITQMANLSEELHLLAQVAEDLQTSRVSIFWNYSLSFLPNNAKYIVGQRFDTSIVTPTNVEDY